MPHVAPRFSEPKGKNSPFYKKNATARNKSNSNNSSDDGPAIRWRVVYPSGIQRPKPTQVIQPKQSMLARGSSDGGDMLPKSSSGGPSGNSEAGGVPIYPATANMMRNAHSVGGPSFGGLPANSEAGGVPIYPATANMMRNARSVGGPSGNSEAGGVPIYPGTQKQYNEGRASKGGYGKSRKHRKTRKHSKSRKHRKSSR